LNEFLKKRFTMVGGLVTLPAWVQLVLWIVSMLSVGIYAIARAP
jgi:hypothetical protein